MFQTKFADKIKTHSLCSVFFPPENRTVDEIFGNKKNDRSSQATDDSTIQRTRFARWITKATDTPPEYIVLLPFPRQWLRQRASKLRYTYCVVSFHHLL